MQSSRVLILAGPILIGLSSGCASLDGGSALSLNSQTEPAGTARARETAENTPFKPRKSAGSRASAGNPDAPGTSLTAAERSGAIPKRQDWMAQVATNHDAETTRLIEKELQDATPEERETLLRDLNGVEPAMVKKLLRIRRSVRQIGHQPNTEPNSDRTQMASRQNAQRDFQPSANNASPTIMQAAASSEDVLSGFGHAVSTAPVRSTPPTPRDLGSASPFGSAQSDARQENGMGSGSSITSAGYGSGRQERNFPSRETSMPQTPPQGGRADGTLPDLWEPLPGTTTAHRPAGQQQPPFADDNGTNQSTPGQGAPLFPTNDGQGGSIAAGSQQPSDGATEQRWSPIAEMQRLANRGINGAGRLLSSPTPDDSMAAGGIQTARREPGDQQIKQAVAEMANDINRTQQVGNATPSWSTNLERLISQAEANVAGLTPGTTDAERQKYISQHVHLRMLYLMAGQNERALQAVPVLEPADQEFWQQMFWAVSNYFDNQGMPDSSDRATQTIAQLKSAILRLQENANLELRNISFCHKISSYGNYERFDRDEFSPGQPVLLYAEVGNFKSEPTSDGQYRTILKSTIEIYRAGPQGALVDSITFPATEDLCRNQRRDYFHSYEFTVPQRISLGPHTLKLTVEDQLSHKIATRRLNFTVQ